MQVSSLYLYNSCDSIEVTTVLYFLDTIITLQWLPLQYCTHIAIFSILYSTKTLYFSENSIVHLYFCEYSTVHYGCICLTTVLKRNVACCRPVFPHDWFKLPDLSFRYNVIFFSDYSMVLYSISLSFSDTSTIEVHWWAFLDMV